MSLLLDRMLSADLEVPDVALLKLATVVEASNVAAYLYGNEKKTFMLAHESTTKDGWWGILEEHVKTLESESEKRGSLTGEQYCFIRLLGVVIGLVVSTYLELIDIIPLKPDKQTKYHLTSELPNSQFELAPPFFSIGKFIELSELGA